MVRRPPAELIDLDDAVKKLATVDDRKNRGKEVRLFGGLSVKETAEALKLSPDTVKLDWKLARVWSLEEITDECGDGR